MSRSIFRAPRLSRRAGVPCTAPGEGTAPRACRTPRGGVLTSGIVASRLGLDPIVTLEKQLLNMIGNLV